MTSYFKIPLRMLNTCKYLSPGLTWDRQSVSRPWKIQIFIFVCYFGTVSCLLTALKGLLLNPGSISLKGSRRCASEPPAACPRLHCTHAQSSSRTGACSLLPVASLPLGFPLQWGTEHESNVVFALRPISFADGIQEWCFVL